MFPFCNNVWQKNCLAGQLQQVRRIQKEIANAKSWLVYVVYNCKQAVPFIILSYCKNLFGVSMSSFSLYVVRVV